jgi:hypothetical protein
VAVVSPIPDPYGPCLATMGGRHQWSRKTSYIMFGQETPVDVCDSCGAVCKVLDIDELGVIPDVVIDTRPF